MASIIEGGKSQKLGGHEVRVFIGVNDVCRGV